MTETERLVVIVDALRELGLGDAVVAALSEPRKKRTIADERWHDDGNGNVHDEANDNTVYWGKWTTEIALLPDLVRAVDSKMYDTARAIIAEMGVER